MVKPYHKWCEQETARLCGGKLTCGSGNKHTRGDVDAVNWRIEVKSTINEKFINVKRSWLDVLETLSDKMDVALVCWYGCREGFVLYRMGSTNSSIEYKNWSTEKIYKGYEPDFVYTATTKWNVEPIHSLTELND